VNNSIRLSVTVLQHSGTVLLRRRQPRSLAIIPGNLQMNLSLKRFLNHLSRFATYNTLEKKLPPGDTTVQKLFRQAFIGFVASIISDSVSNSLHVVKTYRQVDEERVGYCEFQWLVLLKGPLIQSL
jgi:hypothetical protein